MVTIPFDPHEIAIRLRAIMIWKGLSRPDVTNVTGIARNKVGHIVMGRNRPSPELVSIMKERLGVTADYVYFGDAAGMPPDFRAKIIEFESLGRSQFAEEFRQIEQSRQKPQGGSKD